METWKNFEICKSSYIKEEQNLLDFQQYSIYQALNKKAFLLGLSTGSGKTFTSLSSFFYYKEKYDNTKLIIITNKSALFQFNSEIDKFFNYAGKRIVLHSDLKGNYKKARENAYSEFSKDADVLIMNYPVLKLDIDKILDLVADLKKTNKIFVIYDEATAFKNTSTAAYKSVLKLTSKVDKCLALTATLSKGKLEEAYGIFRGIGIPLTKTKALFLDAFCITKNVYRTNIKQIVGYKNIDQFKKVIEPHCILLNKSDINSSLPSFITKVTYLDLDDTQKENLQLIEDGYFLEQSQAEKAPEDYKEISELTIKLMAFGYNRRCLLDPSILYKDDKYPNYLSPKTNEIINLLDEDYNNEKIVIYSHSKRYIDLLEKIIPKKCTNHNYKKILKITGDISTVDRERYKDLFTNDPNHNLIIINTAGIESINLQISNTLIVCDIPSNSGNLIQLLGRISRIGSNHTNLFVNYLLIKDHQDVDEYFIINKQLLLLKNILGESEKNIIDFEILKQDYAFNHMSSEELSTSSIDQILLNKNRKK